MTQPRIEPTLIWQSPIGIAYDEFSATVVKERLARADSLDPRITEIVRLRCARTHDCRVCQSLRDVTAREAGLGDDLTDQIDRFEQSDFPESWKVALRITDATILSPGMIDDQLRADARRHFSDTQITEILFDIMKWSWQKGLVALRVEAEMDGIRDVRYQADGEALLGEAALQPAS